MRVANTWRPVVTLAADRHHKQWRRSIRPPGRVDNGGLLKKIAAHAAHDHAVTEMTPELAAKVKSAIRDDVHAK